MIAAFRPEILYTVVYVPENNICRTLAHFFSIKGYIHNLQATFVSTNYNQKNKSNNMKLNSASAEPYILLQSAIRLQNKLNGKTRL